MLDPMGIEERSKIVIRGNGIVPNLNVAGMALNIVAVYGVEMKQAMDAVTSAARELGYPRPVRDGIWPRDLFNVIRLVHKRLERAA